MTLIYAALLLAILAVTYVILKRRPSLDQSDGPWPYYAKDTLTRTEQVLYHRLVAALPTYIVLAQVQVSRILGVKKGFEFNAWNNRINRMSYDFVVCEKNFGVIAIIELDDKSHEKVSRIEADAKKGRATAAAGIPLIRWQASALPDETSIRQALAKHMRPTSPSELIA